MAFSQMIQGGLRRCYNSPVLWLWAFNGLRAASGLLVLPLLLRRLPVSDLGMFYIFLRITALLPIIDFGFSPTVARFVSYASAGAKELKPQGIIPVAAGLPMNKQLLWELLFTYRRLYRILSLLALFVLGAWGTWNVALNVQTTAFPALTWWAWGTALVAAVLEIYAGWWNVFLRGMNEVLLSARLAVLGYILQLILACVLLTCGVGLLSMPIASLSGSLLQRSLSRAGCLRLLEPKPTIHLHSQISFALLWPNTWRVGLQFLSVYLGTSVPALIFAAKYGASTFAQYGLSAQIIGFCSAMASVWTIARWPIIMQLQSRSDYGAMRRILAPASRLQSLTYFLLATSAVLASAWVLQHIAPSKHVIATKWLALLAVAGLLELRFSFWTTLLSTENRVPSL
ncbi:MAG: hypothetical protein ACXWBP_05360, partial [Limisphaerales bacterium]